MDPCALGGPEDSKGRQHDAHHILQGVLRDSAEWSVDDKTDREHDDGGRRGADGREAHPVLGTAEGDHAERNLQALEKDALEGNREGVPIDAARAGASGGAGSALLLDEDPRFVRERLETTSPQDRPSAPMQYEGQPERPGYQ